MVLNRKDSLFVGNGRGGETVTVVTVTDSVHNPPRAYRPIGA